MDLSRDIYDWNFLDLRRKVLNHSKKLEAFVNEMDDKMEMPKMNLLHSKY